jgi:hypothetical protein
LLPAISLEDEKGRVRTLIDRFLDWIKKVFQWLVNNTDPIYATLKTLQFQIEQFDIRAAAEGVNARSGAFSMSTHSNALAIRYRPVSTIQELLNSLYIYKSKLDGYYGYINTTLSPGIRRVLPSLSALAKGGQFPAREMSQLAPTQLENELKLKPFNPNGTLQVTGHLLGNYRLYLDRPTVAPVTSSGFEKVRFGIMHSENNPKPTPREWDFQRFNYLSTKQCIDEVNDIVGILADAFSPARRQQLDGTLKQVESVTRSLSHQNMDSRDLSQTLDLLKRMVMWLTNPHQGMATRAIATVRGSLTVCQRNRL